MNQRYLFLEDLFSMSPRSFPAQHSSSLYSHGRPSCKSEWPYAVQKGVTDESSAMLNRLLIGSDNFVRQRKLKLIPSVLYLNVPVESVKMEAPSKYKIFIFGKQFFQMTFNSFDNFIYNNDLNWFGKGFLIFEIIVKMWWPHYETNFQLSPRSPRLGLN